MKRTLLSLLFILSMSIASRAQWVAIPDNGFGNWLNNHGYSSCLSGSFTTGWLLDTTCNRILADTAFSCGGGGNTFPRITGIRYFKNVRRLECSFSNFTSLPELPASLRYLDCSANPIDSWPIMPDSLLYLDCSSTVYSPTGSIPVLPNNLIEFRFDGNNYHSLPSLPNSLKILHCSFSWLNVMPAVLPDSLVYLNCSRDFNLNYLPSLPASLQYLDCQECSIYIMPPLPASLTYLDCHNDKISNLPTLPASLTYLNCAQNLLTSLPPLPTALRMFDCSFNNNIDSIPALPTSLDTFICFFNNLTALPALPDSLSLLDCSTNEIASLPVLPSSLIYLNCSSNNPLSSLPPLPASLQYLDCSNSYLLNSLPSLPNLLSYLDCSHDNINSLPTLPSSLVSLNLSVNPISCLPRIYPNRMTDFFINGTHVHCLPNHFSAINYDLMPDTMHLCDPGAGCDFFYNLAGNVHNDTAGNCVTDSLYPGTSLRNMKMLLKSNGDVIQQFYTFNGGGYSFKIDSLATYDISIDNSFLPLTFACPSTGTRNVVLSPYDSVEQNENFGLTCSATDFGVLSISTRFRAAQSNPVYILAGNSAQLLYGAGCGMGSSGTVTTIWSGPANYFGPASGALTPSSVSGDTLRYNLADLNSLQNGSLDIIMAVDSHAIRGSLICLTTIITAATNVGGSFRDTLRNCFSIHNSHDPNLKEVYPDTVTQPNQWLTYTIHFQNTGNDTAYTVVVKDTLSPYLDAASFQYLASSHHAIIQLFGSAMVFTFPKINLVDSATNAPLSEGWIQYKVRTNAHVPYGSQIANTGSIYFDLNPAVVTNTVVSSVQTCVSVYDTFSIVGCAGLSYVFGGATRTASGYYTDSMQTAAGCDSIVTLHLVVMPNSYDTISHTLCAGDSFVVGVHVYRTAGIYTDTLQMNSRCDSVVTLHLIVLPHAYDTISQTICTGDSFAVGAHVHSTAGTFTDTLPSMNYCDSIVTLHLAVLPHSYDTISHTICAGDIFAVGGHIHGRAGTYNDTLPSNNYCDSIVTLHLSVNALPAVDLNWRALVHAHHLIAPPFSSDTVYCPFPDNEIFRMIGGTPPGGHYLGSFIQNDTFNRNNNWDNHSYYDPLEVWYVYTDSNGCVNAAFDTFYTPICEGINDINSPAFLHLYPDPNSGTFTLETNREQGEEYLIYDMLGQLVQQQAIRTDSQNIDLGTVAPGVYTLLIKGKNGGVRFTVMR